MRDLVQDARPRSSAAQSFRELLQQCREDWIAHDRSWLRPGTHALVVYRLGKWGQTLPGPARAIVHFLYRLLYHVVRMVHRIQLPLTAEIGSRVRIAHFGTVIIGDWTRVGDDCLIRHNVTLGARRLGHKREAPTLENGVEIGPGVVIMGAVTVGAGAKIAPNSVVFTDVPAGARVFAPAAEIREPRTRQSSDD